jgi:hypothetical protein
MAESDISGEQWLELYRHLLARLEERRFDDVRSAVEAAAFAPVFEEGSVEEDVRISKLVRGEVGKRVLRRRTPAEVFGAAVGVLQTRLVELPAVAAAVSQHLDRAPSAVEFRVDYEEQYAPTQSEPISLERISVSKEESGALSAAFERLGVATQRMGAERRGNTR